MKAPMLDVIEIENQYYVRAKSSLADTRTNVLMACDTFAVFDRQGNFRTTGSTEQGLFYKESRHLSRWVLRLAQDYFLLLSSNVRADNALLSVDLTNPEMRLGEQRTLRPNAWEGRFHITEQLVQSSFQPITVRSKAPGRLYRLRRSFSLCSFNVRLIQSI